MPAQPAKEKLENYPAISMAKRVLQLFRESLDEKLRPYGVTAAQLHLLAKLEAGEGISGAKLARACLITPQTTQVLLRGLEANGSVSRKKDPENERVLLATLTPLGKRRLARCRVAIGRIYARMLDGFSGKERSELLNFLSRCAENLGREGESSESRTPAKRRYRANGVS